MEFLGPAAALLDLQGGVLVVPAVTHANVGELAVDVLVATLRPEYLGPLEDANVLPCVGNDAYDSAIPGNLSTALELFRAPGTKLYFMQQRAPAARGRQQAFADDLATWAAAAGVAQVVVLAGLDAQLRKDQQIEGSPIRYLAGGADASDEAACSNSGLQRLEADVLAEEREVHSLLPPWPFLESCSRANLRYTVLGCFAAEGDNAGEGMLLARAAAELLHRMLLGPADANGAGNLKLAAALEAQQLRAPASWVGLYGRTFPKEIF